MGAGAAAAGEGVVGGGKTYRRVSCFDETTPRGAKVRGPPRRGAASQNTPKYDDDAGARNVASHRSPPSTNDTARGCPMAAQMLKLEPQSAILEEALGARLIDGKREPCEVSCADFDDALFKLVVLPGQESVLTLHAKLPCYNTLLEHGGARCLETTFAGLVTQPEQGYDVALSVNADECAAPTETLRKLARIKRHLVGAPFEAAFEALVNGTARDLPVARLPWRRGESAYIVAGNDPASRDSWDRVTVIFAVDFREETDKAYARVFLQQFQERARALGGAPPCVFSEGSRPPREIQSVGAEAPTIAGYVSFVIFRSHVATPQKLEKTCDLLVGFRNYVHFHIKAAKTNMHMRMRRKVASWIQVVNRAVLTSDKPREMKTAGGKTFTRK